MTAIIGTPSNDVLFGTGGDDYFDGKAGEDALNGSFGNDTYLVTNPGTVIVEYPREGFDKAIVSFNYSLPDNVENLDLEAGIFGRGNRLNNLLEGNRSNNRLRGVSGSDILYGFDGNDMLDGGGGNDRLFGGGGKDTLIGGGGYDELDGGDGNDTYIVQSYSFKIIERAGRSQDTLKIPLNYSLKTGIENLVLLGRARFGTGSAGDNTISGNRFANLLSGLEGDDTLLGDRGSDILYGNPGRDTLDGGGGDDQLFGQTGNDRLLGEQGNDQLVGEGGNDILNGWGGGQRERDRLTGGEGADRFVIGQRLRDSAYLGSGYATIVDFDRSERDQIQIGSPISRYRLVNRNSIGAAKADTAIYQGRDLIAIVQDATLNRRDLIVASL